MYSSQEQISRAKNTARGACLLRSRHAPRAVLCYFPIAPSRHPAQFTKKNVTSFLPFGYTPKPFFPSKKSPQPVNSACPLQVGEQGRSHGRGHARFRRNTAAPATDSRRRPPGL